MDVCDLAADVHPRVHSCLVRFDRVAVFSVCLRSRSRSRELHKTWARLANWGGRSVILQHCEGDMSQARWKVALQKKRGVIVGSCGDLSAERRLF